MPWFSFPQWSTYLPGYTGTHRMRELTSDLLAAVLGERFGVFAGLIQLVAYLVIGAKCARLVAVSLLGQFLSIDPTAPIARFVVGSIAAVVAAGRLDRSSTGSGW
jgi:hypothetical protein